MMSDDILYLLTTGKYTGLIPINNNNNNVSKCILEKL